MESNLLGIGFMENRMVNVRKFNNNNRFQAL